MTRGAAALLEEHNKNPAEFIAQHLGLVPGMLCEEDVQANIKSVEQGTRVFSKYAVADGNSVYVITEYDRSVTTIMLPDEY